MQCPQCQHDNPPDAKFCIECARPIERRCAACGTQAHPTAKFCPECAAPLTVKAPPVGRDAGERRHLTALFCDLVGSTDIASRLDPEEWYRISRAYQEAAAAAVTRFGGHVDKFLGDGLVCFFGVPQAHEDDAEQAVRAGLAIVDEVRGINHTAAGQAAQLRVRVGVHTGSAVVAHGGGASKDVFGDTPNIAARVQSAAEADTVLITGATQRLVAGLFVVEERGAHHLKGVPQAVVLYRVVQASGVRGRLAAAGQVTGFVGREVELTTLIDRWARVREGEGQAVVLLGEAGVGKSRLVYEMREHLAGVPHAWLECGATPYTQGTPFHPILALVAQGMGFATKDGVAEKLSKLEAGLAQLSDGSQQAGERSTLTAEHGDPTGSGRVKPFADDRTAPVAPEENLALLADFLGLPTPTPPAMSPELQRRKTIDLLTRWILSLSTTRPLIVAIEDLHWCDASTLELLGHLIADSPTAHLLVLATARPDLSPPWPPRPNLATLQLTRLSTREARAMVALLGAGALPYEMVETLIARADGIPLYVEELTRAVVEPGVAQGTEAIPSTLADSLMARLDRLSTGKEVAQHAAVLGRELPYALLLALGGMPEVVLRDGLARLVEAEILHVRGEPPDATYTFKHVLVQEAAYGSLLRRTRQQLHGEVVDILRERFPERVAAEPEVVARHAELAGRIGDAIAYHGLAGEHAQARSAHEEAIGQFRKAIALLATWAPEVERNARELALQFTLGTSLIAVRGYSHAETGAAFGRAADLAAKANTAVQLGAARIGLAIFHANRGELERGRTLLVDVLVAAEARDDQHQAMMCYANLAPMEHYQGRPASSLTSCERAIALYDPAQYEGKPRMIGAEEGVVALGVAGWDLWQLGHPDAALARAQAAVALARRLDRPFALAFALFFEVVVHWNRDRGGSAALHKPLAEVVALSEDQGFRLWLGIGRVFSAVARVTDGDNSALADIMENLTLAGETGNQAGAPALMLTFAEAQRAAGQLDAARGTVAAALAFSEQTGQPFWDADLHRLDGDLLVATGGTDDDVAAYHRALGIAREQGARSLELRAATSLARLWRKQGRRSEARDLLAPVYSRFSEGFDTRDLIDAKALIEDLSE